MKRIMITALTALVLCISTFTATPAIFASAEENSDGTKTSVDTGKLMYITLQENTAYRWNANGEAAKSNEIHLDDTEGMNCSYRFDYVEDNWYGIKHINKNGIDRFVDIEDKSKDDGKVLHLWEDDDNKVKGNNHRQFAFYYVGDDANGNRQYYIQNRNSGLWMGYEDTDKNGKPSYGDKIIQTKKEKRKLWIVTPAVIPKSGNESEDLIKTETGQAYCEIYNPGTIESINRNSDSVTNGTGLHLYQMGTSSKWALEWIDEYQAYKIHALTDGEADLGKVWDVTGQSGDEYAGIHIWDNNSNDGNKNTSNLWRFIKQKNGTYKIQSARTGKFANDGTVEKDGTKTQWLSQTNSGTEFALEFFASDGDEISYNYSQDWMAELPDDAVLSSVNLPGSHDAGTAAIVEDFMAQLSFTSCQKLYYEEQLNVGVRSFDIRCNATKDKAVPSDVRIIHGSEKWACSNRDASDLTLDDIFTESVRFLDEHPTETIVMMIKDDDGSAEGLARAVGNFLKTEVKKYNHGHVWTGDYIPSVKEARGKIVFFRRYEIDTLLYPPAGDELKIEWFGIDVSDWDDHAYSGAKYYAPRIYGTDRYGKSVYAQDAYNENYADKLKYIEGTMAQTTGSDPDNTVPDSAWVFNYTSCAKWRPLETAKFINPDLFEDKFGSDKQGYIDNRRLGMVMLNFVDRPMSRLIYETNLGKTDFLTAKAVFPDEISLKKGQKLSEAVLSGHIGNGRWVFEKGSYVPDDKDFRTGRTYKLKFIPSDDRLQGVEKEVKITSFNGSKIPSDGNNGQGKTGKDSPGTSKTATSDSTNMYILAAVSAAAALAAAGIIVVMRRRRNS